MIYLTIQGFHCVSAQIRPTVEKSSSQAQKAQNNCVIITAPDQNARTDTDKGMENLILFIQPEKNI